LVSNGALGIAQKLLAQIGAHTLFCGLWTFGVEVLEF